jgi:hypothetical protein
MPKKGGKGKSSSEGDLWVAPKYSLKGDRGDRAWENRPGGPPNSSRFLELADIALGVKSHTPNKKTKSHQTHVVAKTEPYST